MTGEALTAPLAGLRVVDVALGSSLVGAGLAANLPGALLRDFGAEVTRVENATRLSLDTGVEWHRAWNRGKEVRTVTETDAVGVVRLLAHEADMIFLAGGEEAIEQRGLGYQDLARLNPSLIVARIRPSYIGSGPVPDYELLVNARAGVLTQIRGHRPGPIFAEVPAASAGAALCATAGALAHRRPLSPLTRSPHAGVSHRVLS